MLLRSDGTTSAFSARSHHMPTRPQFPMASSRYIVVKPHGRVVGRSFENARDPKLKVHRINRGDECNTVAGLEVVALCGLLSDNAGVAYRLPGLELVGSDFRLAEELEKLLGIHTELREAGGVFVLELATEKK